jgi:hypothetical protein
MEREENAESFAQPRTVRRVVESCEKAAHCHDMHVDVGKTCCTLLCRKQFYSFPNASHTRVLSATAVFPLLIDHIGACNSSRSHCDIFLDKHKILKRKTNKNRKKFLRFLPFHLLT